MLNKFLYKSARYYGGAFAPLFFLLSVGLFIGLPLFEERKTFIDENAVGHVSPYAVASDVTLRPVSAIPTHAHQLIRGRRSTGTEVVAVYANRAYNASVVVADALMRALRRRPELSSDVHFFFVDETQPWPTPKAYTRYALVLNITSDVVDFVCIDLYGANAVQPNQDLINVARREMWTLGMTPSVLCQGLHNWHRKPPKMRHYIYALESAIQLPLRPFRWHQIPTHGISTLTISSGATLTAATGENQQTTQGRIAKDTQLLTLSILRTMIGLNGLEERFHHSTFVWVPLGVDSYVQFDALQFCILLFAACILSTAYANYQHVGVNASPLIALLFCTTLLADYARGWGGVWAACMMSLLLVCLLAWCVTPALATNWMILNALALVLMLVLHPPMALLGGAASALQLSFLHRGVRRGFVLYAGAVVAWLAYNYFTVYLKLPLLRFDDVGCLFVGFFLYPNALIVTSRLVRHEKKYAH